MSPAELGQWVDQVWREATADDLARLVRSCFKERKFHGWPKGEARR